MNDFKMSYDTYKMIEFHKEKLQELRKRNLKEEINKYYYMDSFCEIFMLDKNSPNSIPYIDEIQRILWIQFYWAKYQKQFT